MDQTIVKASVGREHGTRPSRRLRAEGQIPAVVYGLGKEPQPVSVGYAELREALSGEAGMNTVLTLDIDGTQERVLVRSVQRDPIKRVVTHADFMRVDANKPVKVKVPIILIGDSSNVTSRGGLIEQKRFELELECPPDSIPIVIEADVSDMTLDRRISVDDLTLPPGATTRIPGEISVAAPVIPRVTLALEAEEEEEEGEEEAEAAEGGEESAEADASDDGAGE